MSVLFIFSTHPTTTEPTMTHFSAQAWAHTLPIYESILKHEFISELTLGCLEKTKFHYYIQQDALYLADFGKALALLAVKSDTQEDVLQFLQFAQGAIVVEKALHENYFKTFQIEGTTQKAPACFAYTHFLLSTTALQSIEIGAAAVLPCFWIYREVGKYIWKAALPDNPYQQWIDTYAGDEFDVLVTKMIEITNRLAAQTTETIRQQMMMAFEHSSRLEWAFWNDAYTLTQWQPE